MHIYFIISYLSKYFVWQIYSRNSILKERNYTKHENKVGTQNYKFVHFVTSYMDFVTSPLERNTSRNDIF